MVIGLQQPSNLVLTHSLSTIV